MNADQIVFNICYSMGVVGGCCLGWVLRGLFL